MAPPSSWTASTAARNRRTSPASSAWRTSSYPSRSNPTARCDAGRGTVVRLPIELDDAANTCSLCWVVMSEPQLRWELEDAPRRQGSLFGDLVERQIGRGEFRGMEFLCVRA